MGSSPARCVGRVFPPGPPHRASQDAAWRERRWDRANLEFSQFPFKGAIRRPKYFTISDTHGTSYNGPGHTCVFANRSSGRELEKWSPGQENRVCKDAEVCSARGVFREGKTPVWLKLAVRGMGEQMLETSLARLVQIQLPQRALKLPLTGCVSRRQAG